MRWGYKVTYGLRCFFEPHKTFAVHFCNFLCHIYLLAFFSLPHSSVVYHLISYCLLNLVNNVIIEVRVYSVEDLKVGRDQNFVLLE